MRRRSLAELTTTDEPAWPMVQGWLAQAKNHVEVLPPAATRADTLFGLQVTTRSPLGAIAYETGGIVVDHGWVRLLGSGHPRLPRDLIGWNRACGLDLTHGAPGFVLIADDVVGGFFALDGGEWGTPHHVFYFAPDRAAWEDTGRGYSDFVGFLLQGDLDGYYADFRWDGWQREVEAVPGDHAYGIYPPAFTRGDPIPQRSRRLLTSAGLYHFYQQVGRQIEDVADGDWIQFVVGQPTKP
jgi:hypothetical protein